MCRPLHKCRALLGPSCYGVEPDGRDDAGVGEGGVGGNDGVGDIMVDCLRKFQGGERW